MQEGSEQAEVLVLRLDRDRWSLGVLGNDRLEVELGVLLVLGVVRRQQGHEVSHRLHILRVQGPHELRGPDRLFGQGEDAPRVGGRLGDPVVLALEGTIEVAHVA